VSLYIVLPLCTAFDWRPASQFWLASSASYYWEISRVQFYRIFKVLVSWQGVTAYDHNYLTLIFLTAIPKNQWTVYALPHAGWCVPVVHSILVGSTLDCVRDNALNSLLAALVTAGLTAVDRSGDVSACIGWEYRWSSFASWIVSTCCFLVQSLYYKFCKFAFHHEKIKISAMQYFIGPHSIIYALHL